MSRRCPLQPNKKFETKAARNLQSSAKNKKHTDELSEEEMQRIFESKMASAGRFGSSRQH
jgi:hypothetical protein